MKTKFLFASLVASAVMVGCSNEELADVQNAASNDNLALIFDGFEGVESRMAYDGDNGSFLWEVGDQIGVSRVSGKGVTTNYLFDAELVSDDNTKPITHPAWDGTTSPAAQGKYAYFTTAFGSIFKGNYVVYYPYNPDFCEDGKIVAKLNIGQTEVTASKEEHVATDGFMMSKAVAFEGGQKAEKFALYPVFGRLVVNVKTADNCEIETIVLRSLNGKTLPTAMEIDADINVVDGKLNPAYMHVVESSKVEEIVMSVDGNDANANATTGYTAYFTLIPGTYTNFAIDVVTDKGTFTKTFTSASISTGNRANVNLSFAASDMVLKRTYYATSAASWKTTVEKIASSMTISEADPATIKVMNDIKLDATNTFRPSQAIHPLVPVTVEGVGSIEIPAGALGSVGAMTNVTFNVPVEAAQFTSVAGENIEFAAGLEAGTVTIQNDGSSYIVNGGEINVVNIAATSTTAAKFDNVKFTGAVTSNQTAALNANNIAKVNFNNCTFEAGLTNTAGSIRVDGATIVDPNAYDATYSTLNVTGGNVYVKNTITVENVDVAGELNLENGATAINNSLAAITGTINVNKDATLTLSSSVNYTLNGKIKVEGKLVNNGTLTAIAAAVIDDMTQNNHKGILENNGTVRVNTAAYEGVWYNNQNITFVNSANYNVVLSASNFTLDQANFKKYVAKEDVTGIELNSNATAATILLQGRGTAASGAYVIDFSDKNLILNANSADITAQIVDGLKFKNITVKGAGEVLLEVSDATKNASFTTGNLNINGELTLTEGPNAYVKNVKANVTNVTVAKNAKLNKGALVTYTGTFTNNGTVSGGNPVK